MILEIKEITVFKEFNDDVNKCISFDVIFKNNAKMNFSKCKNLLNNELNILFDFDSDFLEIFNFNMRDYSLMNTNKLIFDDQYLVINLNALHCFSALHFKIKVNDKALTFLDKLKEFIKIEL